MVVYSLEEFGGLEEIVTTLAGHLQQQGHQTSVLSTAWVEPENQYFRRLCESGVPVVHLPKWLALPASHWPTKEKIVANLMWFATPLVLLLSGLLVVLRTKSWRPAHASAYGWLRGLLMRRFIAPDRRRPLVRLLLRWWQLRWRPDLLHIHGYTDTTLFVIDWAHAQQLPVVYEEHQTPDIQFDWWQDFHKSINKATLVVAVSEKSAQALRTICKVTRPIVVANPIVSDPHVAGNRQANQFGGHDGPLTVTTVARLFVTKGLTHLLEAIAVVQRTYPAVRFRVHGEGPLRQELLAYADKLGLDGEAIFVGAFTDRAALGRILGETDVFVMSSILEGQPLGIVEAMAYGCPIVSTAVGGIPELIRDGVNGLLCRPADPACLAQQIITLIEDSTLRIQLAAAARRTYEESAFQPAAVCAHFLSIYQRALDANGPDVPRTVSGYPSKSFES